MGKQAKQIGCMGEINISCVDNLNSSVCELQGAKLTIAPQSFIKQRLLFFDQPRFQQQGTNFSRRTNPANAFGLTQHCRFVCGTQVRQHAAANIDAFTNIERHSVAFTVKQIDTWRGGKRTQKWTQVLRIFIDCRCLKCQAWG